MNERRPPGCENCQKDTVIHLTQIIDGQVQKIDMCDSCPKSNQLQDPMEFGLMEQLLGMALQPMGIVGPGPDKLITCSHCGYNENQFKKTGRLGCGHCYTAFILPKRDILNKIHNAAEHLGKVPKSQSRIVYQQKLKALKKRLAQLVHDENYEEAAKIRDQIKSLKKT